MSTARTVSKEQAVMNNAAPLVGDIPASTYTSAREALMAAWNLQKRMAGSRSLRYGFSVACVAIALALARVFQHYGFHELAPPFNLAIAVATWYGGVGPAAVALVLSMGCFDYFLSPPLHSFVLSRGDLPSFLVFTVWAVLIASFAEGRRRIEDDLSHARDDLQIEVEHRKQQEGEIRKLNQELTNRATELESSNKELESFAYSVSHDLRAPLRHVVGFSELLQKQAASLLDDKSRRYIKTILDSSKRMGNLIDDLLSFSRIGRAETKKSLVNLEQLVKDVVSEIERETRGRDIAWRIDALPLCYGDRSMLMLVLTNLISNAVKFTRMRTRAEIEIGCANRDNDDVEVFVRDNGAGFDMQYADKLFGVFQRLHRADEFEGTGIGLATVQRIIHRHGGKVRAEGTVDEGATFYFSVPKAQHSEAGAASTL
jgi:signal transduction histidine kinase